MLRFKPAALHVSKPSHYWHSGAALQLAVMTASLMLCADTVAASHS